MECPSTMCILVIGLLIQRTLSLQNLAAIGTADQSGSHYYPNNVTYDASKAIDGNTDHTWNTQNCAHTPTNQRSAWWRLDIGQVASIHRVVIYYRNGQSGRLDGFYLYISNSSSTWKSGHECFHDPYDGGRINTIQNITCDTVGRYVVFYNERCKPEAYVELCEVEVFGCLLGKYGTNCSSSCSEHCRNSPCDIMTGNCTCNPGYEGAKCTEECDQGTFGNGCQDRCNCFDGASCDNVNGTCPNGTCDPGWRPNTCSEECDQGTFGNGCQDRCNCFDGASCDNVNGTCPNGTCDQGWRSNTCSEECIKGTYGVNCNQSCSNCIPEKCDHVTGVCTVRNSCKPGYLGSKCDQECVKGNYGVNCSMCCSNCISEICDHVTGVCTVRNSCKPGYLGSKCDQGQQHEQGNTEPTYTELATEGAYAEIHV